VHELTSFQRDILWVLGGLEHANGTDVKEALEQYQQPPIHNGRLYPNLDELTARGLITKGVQSQRSNEYGLTDEGWEALHTRRGWENQYAGRELTEVPQP